MFVYFNSGSTDSVLARVQMPPSLCKKGFLFSEGKERLFEKLLLPPYPSSISKHAYIQEKGRQEKLEN